MYSCVYGSSPPSSVPSTSILSILRPMPFVVFSEPKMSMGHVHTKGKSCQHLCWLAYNHPCGNKTHHDAPQVNRLPRGWFQIVQLWEGSHQPSSCSCDPDWGSGGITLDLYGSFWSQIFLNVFVTGGSWIDLQGRCSVWKCLQAFLKD